MKIKNTFFVILMLSLPAISAEHSDMKMSDMHSSASSQEYMAGMKDMHDKMMAAVNEPDPDKAFAKGMIAHHEGAIAMAETELKYGIYGHSRFCNTDFDDKLACLNLSGV